MCTHIPVALLKKANYINMNINSRYGKCQTLYVNLKSRENSKNALKTVDNVDKYDVVIFRRDVVYFGIDEYGDSLLTYYKVSVWRSMT